MCLIAYRSDPSTHITDDIIDYNIRSNPDGFGITWKNNKGLNTRKFAPSEKKQFRRLLKQIDSSVSPYVAHWRFATHGEKSREMSHPFIYNDATGKELITFHNGIINIATRGKESDTLAFVNRVLSRLPFGWWADPFIKNMVEDAIGWSRMLFWTQKGVVLINERAWVEEDGILYSTTPSPSWVSYPGTTSVKPTRAYGDDDDDTPLLPAGPSTYVVGSMTQVKDDFEPVYAVHEQHTVVTEDRWEADDPNEPITATGSVTCLTCQQMGDYYEVDRQLFYEIDHSKPDYNKFRKGVPVPAKASGNPIATRGTTITDIPDHEWYE